MVSGGLLALVFAIWAIAAPTQFGGPVSYVVVTGNSMEPSLEDGDLAVVRAADRYQPGDIVAYRHPNIGTVIHRILAIEDGRYVFKGDNNAWIDSNAPPASELIGSLWVQVPRIGRLMEATRSGGILPILGGLGGAIIMVSFLGSGDKTLNARRRRYAVRATRGGPLGENAQSLLAALGMAVAAFSLLAVFSFAQSTDQIVPREARFEHSGVFQYSASAPGASVYDSETVATGQPVFRKLASEVDFTFVYQFSSLNPSEVSGTQRLIAVLSDTNGWKRSLPLTTEAPFEGGEFTVRGALNLDEVQRLMDSLETETGIKKDHYEIAVIPEVSAMGLISGQPFSEVFAPRLGFRIDPLQLQLLPPGLRESDPRMPSQSGVVRIMQVEPNTLPILGSKLAVGDARRLALLGLTLCVAVGLAVGFYLLRGVGEDEPSRIAARLGSMLVSIRSEGPRGGRIVDVESIDDLARLAERAGGVVLHEVKGTTHHYLVQDGQTIYRYQAFGRRVEAVAAAAEPVGQ